MSDYFLNKIYDSLLSKKPVPKKPEPIVEKKKTLSKAPKTLSGAYQTVLTERVAFYVTPVEQDKPAPLYQGLEQIGIVQNDQEAKSLRSRIKSFSILDTTTKMLNAAGWETANPILDSKELRQLIFNYNINVEDLTNISKNKNKLVFLQDTITNKQQTTFNLIETLYKGIEQFLTKTNQEDIKKFFESLINKQGTVKGTNVGPGEILCSLFSNSSKPLKNESSSSESEEEPKGDLKFGSIKVELKQTGAKLGYAFYADANIKSEMAKVINNEQKLIPHAELSRRISSFEDKVSKLKEFNNYGFSIFNDSLINQIKEFNVFIKKTDMSGFQQSVQNVFNFNIKNIPRDNSFYQTFIENLLKNKFLTSSETFNPATLEKSNQKEIFVKILEVLKYGYDSIQSLLNKPKYQVKDWNQQSETVAFNELLLSNLNLTPEQITDVLYAVRPFAQSEPSLKSQILKVLKDGYVNRLKRGEDKALRGLVFAIHLSEYARHETFDYLLLFNKTTHKAFSIPTPSNCFESLLELYESKGEQVFRFRVSIGGRQGAHNITI